MSQFDLKSLFNIRVFLGSIFIAGTLLLITVLFTGWTESPQDSDFGFAPADLTVIAAPSSTPAVTPTFTPDPLLVGTPTLAPGLIGVGGFVQISGTDGEGLRLRAAPGLNGEPVFLGFDEEVFQVLDGPQDSDGYTWWYLVAPYDESRSGWAASAFLAAIPSP